MSASTELVSVTHRDESFIALSHRKLQEELYRQNRQKDDYIVKLQQILRENNLNIPELDLSQLILPVLTRRAHELEDASEEQLKKLFEPQLQHFRPSHLTLEFAHLSYIVAVPAVREIPSIGTTLRDMFQFWKFMEPKKEIAILNNITGRIKPSQMTLLIGPPGSGKSGVHIILIYLYTYLC
jgi:ABC-type multidrug transport system fused ATPase/permease subunit